MAEYYDEITEYKEDDYILPASGTSFGTEDICMAMLRDNDTSILFGAVEFSIQDSEPKSGWNWYYDRELYVWHLKPSVTYAVVFGNTRCVNGTKFFKFMNVNNKIVILQPLPEAVYRGEVKVAYYPPSGDTNKYYFHLYEDWTPPNMVPKIDGIVKTYADGRTKIDGALRQVDKVWTKVNGVLREV